MPPELFLGEDEEGHGWAVDMFALGATVFEMVTGAGMFRSEGDLHFRVLWRVGEGVSEVDWSHGAWSSPVGSKREYLL
jgi:serine/threonine protein kinase